MPKKKIEDTADRPKKNVSPNSLAALADHRLKYRFKKGESGNPKGRPKRGLSLMEFARQFLLKTPDGDRQSRLKAQWEALHQIAKDPEHRQCVPANALMLSYSFGPPVPDVSLKIAALQVFQNMGAPAQEYIAMQLTQGDESYVIPESELEEGDIEDAVVVETDLK